MSENILQIVAFIILFVFSSAFILAYITLYELYRYWKNKYEEIEKLIN